MDTRDHSRGDGSCRVVGAIAAFSLLSLLATGCGGSSGNETDGGHESGTQDHKAPPVDGPGKDAHGRKDAGIDALDAGDASEGGGSGIPGEGGPTVPPAATQLVNTVDGGFGGVSLVGITDDDYVIYVGYGSTTPVYAVPVAGGAPIQILADLGSSSSGPSIIHRTVFMWTGVTNDAPTGNSVGTLHFWTKANGSRSTVGSSTVGLIAASPDSKKVVYAANVTTSGTSGDLIAANSDLTGKQTLLGGTTTNSTATNFFDPDIGFTNDDYFVASHEEKTDAGGRLDTISFWDTATWTKNDLVVGAASTSGSDPILTDAYTWSTSTTGAGLGGTVVAATNAGALQAFVLPSAAPIAIDTGVSSFLMKPDGTGVLYATTAGAYRLATLPAPVITTIMTAGYGSFVVLFNTVTPSGSLGQTPSFSPDGSWSTFYKLLDDVNGTYDVDLVHNVATATSTSLLSSATGAIFGDPFTADSAYALYYTNVANGVGDLYAYAVAGSTAGAVSTNNVWNSYAVAGSKVIYSDNYMSNAAGAGFADIYTVDVSASKLAPVSIVKAADQSFFLTADKTKTVFSLVANGNTSTNGIWAITL